MVRTALEIRRGTGRPPPSSSSTMLKGTFRYTPFFLLTAVVLFVRVVRLETDARVGSAVIICCRWLLIEAIWERVAALGLLVACSAFCWSSRLWKSCWAGAVDEFPVKALCSSRTVYR